MNDLERLARGVILTGIDELPARRDPADFAGYLFFARNGESVVELRGVTDALRARYAGGGAPPILAIDQEGGRVVRLREGITAMPPMMALGAAGDVVLAQRAGEQIAFDLRRAGITLDLAPVLDLALDAENVVIGTRSFGADPQRVAALGRGLARAMERGGVQACYKHFPGHGGTAVDSHDALPVLDADEATLRRRDLATFAAVAREAGAMMSAHVVVPALDEQHSATLSRRIATDLLRGELGFGGALLTDCLEMGALADLGTAHSAVEALRAGADLLLFSHHQDLALSAAAAIAAAVEADRLPRARLEEAHARVQRLRITASPPLPIDAVPPHPDIGREIARCAVTLLRGVPEMDPLAGYALAFGGDVAALAHEAPALATTTLSLDPSDEEVTSVLDALARTGRRPLLLARRAHLHAAQAAAIATIVQCYPDAVVVSLLEPFDLPLFSAARHLLAIYGDDAVSLAGLAEVLFSSHLATGILPVSLPVSW